MGWLGGELWKMKEKSESREERWEKEKKLGGPEGAERSSSKASSSQGGTACQPLYPLFNCHFVTCLAGDRFTSPT